MHILINGWFTGQMEAGSGQYLHHLLHYLPRIAPEHDYTLLTPAGAAAVPDWPGVTLATRSLPRLPRQLAKVWWEQVAAPSAARDLHADVLWVPYWAAPYRQPVPTVVTVHDMIPQLLPAYRGGTLQRLYTRLVSATARRATAIITVSEAARRDVLAELDVPAQRVIAIHHGPNAMAPSALSPARLAAVQARYGLPPRYFLYWAALTYARMWGQCWLPMVVIWKLAGTLR